MNIWGHYSLAKLTGSLQSHERLHQSQPAMVIPLASPMLESRQLQESPGHQSSAPAGWKSGFPLSRPRRPDVAGHSIGLDYGFFCLDLRYGTECLQSARYGRKIPRCQHDYAQQGNGDRSEQTGAALALLAGWKKHLGLLRLRPATP